MIPIMTGSLLISTAYLPPIEYFSLIASSEQVLIEMEESYLKQTFRNRCYISSSHGKQVLTVPVMTQSQGKTLMKDAMIDYSKRWQQVHTRAIMASYGSSPYFEFYYDRIEDAINRKTRFLMDLNMELLNILLQYLNIKKPVCCTVRFEPEGGINDYRYKLSPKKEPFSEIRTYYQVFESRNIPLQHLSVVDLIFNMGPDAGEYLTGISNRI